MTFIVVFATFLMVLFSVTQLIGAEGPVGLPADDDYWKVAEAERADQFAKDYIQVIGHVVNATWDLYRNDGAELIKHGESEDCLGSKDNKPLCNVCWNAVNKTILARDRRARPLSATFLRGYMEFPHSTFEVKRKLIDVITCTQSSPVAEERFHLTRAKFPEAAYFLDKVESGGKNDTYVLNGLWVTWYKEEQESYEGDFKWWKNAPDTTD